MKTKHIFLSLAVLILGVSSSVAQDNLLVNPAKVDSLQQLIENHKKEDKEKVRLFNEYARLCFYDLEFLKGLTATREARELSEKLDFEGGKIMYNLTLSAYFGNGLMNTYYQKQAQWLSLSAGRESAKYYLDMDNHSYNLGNDYIGLIDQFSAILQHFEPTGDKEIQAVILWRISYFNFMLRNQEETLNIYDHIIRLYTGLDQMYPVFLISIFKMNGLASLGRNEEAKELETELIEFIAKNRNDNAIGLITSTMATGFGNEGRHALAIEYYLKSLDAFDRIEDLEMRAETYRQMGIAYENLGMNSKASESYIDYLSVIESLKDSSRLYLAYDIMVSPLIALKKYNEARKYMALALGDTLSENRIYILARHNDAEGQILRDQGKYDEAINFFSKAFDGFIQNTHSSSRWGAPFMPLYIAQCYLKLGDYKSALVFALQCLQLENELFSVRTGIKSDVSLVLSEIYEHRGDQQKAFEYLKMHQNIRYESDRLDEANRAADAEIRAIIEKSQEEINQMERDRIQTAQKNRIQRLWIFSISGALVSLIIVSIILYRNNQHKQKANTLLKEQKEKIQVTLEKLKFTQAQLIQSEKMASLGELTAGIAHEIQNPLNFVNNFSEVNNELIDELDEEAIKGNLEEVRAIAKDIKENEQKINHHGKRADAIVKGMLQHSRTSNGIKEPTDINTLSDEYLRLSYHGMRAKDKAFNADFKTNFDPYLPKINVIPQEIGRVLLNLINNAFYVVHIESQHAASLPQHTPQKQPDYKPLVMVSTKNIGNHIEIRVKDNGPGIPPEIQDKIFQPFFTTKPTGQGTGLGLSLSYEIVKAHGGELKVETKQGKGSIFIIIIPSG